MSTTQNSNRSSLATRLTHYPLDHRQIMYIFGHSPSSSIGRCKRPSYKAYVLCMRSSEPQPQPRKHNRSRPSIRTRRNHWGGRPFVGMCRCTAVYMFLGFDRCTPVCISAYIFLGFDCCTCLCISGNAPHRT